MKKKTYIIVAAIIAIAIIITAVIIVNSNNSYKGDIKEFAKACKSEKNMESFIDKYIDLQGAYAAFYSDRYIEIPENSGYNPSNPFKNFEENYKNTKKSDYTSEKFLKDLKKEYSQLAIGNVKVKKIEKPSKWEECDLIDAVKATFELYGEEDTLTFLFYKKKLIGIEELYLFKMITKKEIVQPGFEEFDPNAFEKTGVNYGTYEMIETDYDGDMDYKSYILISNDGCVNVEKIYEKDTSEEYKYKGQSYVGYCTVNGNIMTMKYVYYNHYSNDEKETRDQVDINEKYRIDGNKLIKISSDIDNDNAVYKHDDK